MGLICARCKGKGFCGKRCYILERIKEFSPKIVNLNFSGSSPPEVFVGAYNYPNVFTGILAPPQHNETSILSSPEEWFKGRLEINDILAYRGSLIYSRFKSNAKSQREKLLEVMQEVSMASKSCGVEFFLKKKPKIQINLDSRTPPIGNPAPLKKAKLEENPKVRKEVDYYVSDNEVKSTSAINELYKKGNSITSMIRLLSSGLLGLKTQRKLVPSRWSTTAVDSTVSKTLIKKIKDHPWINKFQVFNEEYLGNHYEILLIPKEWSFEVIEAKMHGSVWNPQGLQTLVAQDYEGYFGRKDYAAEVTGAYYANRVASCEYLSKIRRQASILVLREVREDYWAPLGVGILRESSRNAFNKKPKIFDSLKEALNDIESRIKLPLGIFTEKSKLLKKYKEQRTLKKFCKTKTF